MTVLIVEDELVIARDLSRKLQRAGYTPVAIVDSGEAAIAEIEKKMPDLVLMDIILSGELDGIDAAREISRKFSVPVIFLTAHSDDQMIERAKEAEPYGYLLKPYKEKELTTIIELVVHQRKKTEDRIQKMLDEKEILLLEINHRVKNNLQIICSLLSLQLKNMDDKTVHQKITESKDRVYSMALIQEKLYLSNDLSNIDLEQFIHSLARNLYVSCQKNREQIPLTVSIDSAIVININKSIPCALLINELLSNSLKHGFGKNDRGTITISMTYSDPHSTRLIVRDSGTGIPDMHKDNNIEKLGIKLINILVRQLEGTISTDSENGTVTTITFPT